jgi:hypothetical protein
VAVWQFDFHLIPASSVSRRFRVVPLTISMDEYDRVDWWDEVDLVRDLRADFSSILAPLRSWRPQLEMWGEDDGNRIDVSFEGDQIASVFGRIDVRDLSLVFLNSLVAIARRRDLIMLTEDRHLLSSMTVKAVLSAIHRSSSFAFVSDPEEFLRRLAESERR